MDPYGDTGFERVHVSRSVVNMFKGAQMRRILNHSLGLEYDYELSGGDEDAWVQYHIDMGNLTPCGHDHHGHHGSRSSSFAYRPPQRSTASTCCPSPVKVPPGDSDSERKARLLQESKREKERAERKKKKKMKQKERKRREKLKKENKDAGGKEEEEADDDDDAEQPAPEESVRDKSEEGAAKCETSEDQESKSEEESSEDDNVSCASEELDMTSSFVSKAAVIAKRQLDQKAKAVKKVSEKECKTSVEKPADNKESEASSSPSFEDIIKISTDLAVMGNKCASAGDFVTAVRYFTDAIKYNPTQFKLFGNRSLCFEMMQEYEKALADAELSLGICPGWAKGLFRKGKALAGLKRYDEAASALKQVLRLNPCRVEAAQKLMQVQIIQLMEFGFSREQSSNALIIHRTVEKSLEVLSKLNHTAGAAQISQNLPTIQVVNANGVSPVLSANRKLSPGGGGAAPSSSFPPRAPDAARNVISDKPARPFHSAPQELFPVWVGSLDPSITGDMLYDLFNKVGTVISIKVLTYKRCAFVNFTKQASCEEAIQRYNGYDLNGIRIVVRYPDRIPAGMGISSSAQRAGHQQTDSSFHRRNQSGTRRPV